MTKKRILFAIESLRIGGAEKSLITLLSLLDYEKYEVDLQLFALDGAFMKYVPEQVNVLPLSDWNTFAQMNLWNQLCSRQWQKIWTRISLFFNFRIRQFDGRELDTFFWEKIKKVMTPPEKVYDIAIGYGQYLPTFYVADKVSARRKIGYMNVPYRPSHILKKKMERYFSQLQQVIAVSEDVRTTLIDSYPQLEPKFQVIQDPISATFTQTLAKELIPTWPLDAPPCFVTAARLVQNQKGMDILLRTALYLQQKNIDFRWYILGEGEYRHEMEHFIQIHDLASRLFLLGAIPNPYPYLKAATLYVQTSRFEGYGLSIAEARLLNTPVVTTAYRGWEMQMVNEKNGLVTALTPEAVGDAIIRLLNDRDLYDTIKQYLQGEPKGNLEEYEKFRKFVLNEI